LLLLSAAVRARARAMDAAVAGLEAEVGEPNLNVEKAIENFVHGCEQEVRNRNSAGARDYLAMATAKMAKLQHGPSRFRWEARAKVLQTQITMIPFFRNEPGGGNVEVKVFEPGATDPIVFQCKYHLAHLIRHKINCKSLNIPEQLEFDEHDQHAMHALTFVGDAPCCVARAWIEQQGNARWAVVDRLCAVHDEKYSYRGKKLSRHLVLRLVNYLAEHAARLGITTIVAHAHIRCPQELFDAACRHGFKYVLSQEEVDRARVGDLTRNPPKPKVIYVENGRMRINTLPLYLTLPKADPALAAQHLEVIQTAARRQLALVFDPEQQRLIRELMPQALPQQMLEARHSQLQMAMEEQNRLELARLQQQQQQQQQQHQQHQQQH